MKFICNMWQVFIGRKSFVGYHVMSHSKTQESLLPNLKKGILTPLSGMENLNKEAVDQINIIYAKDYSILNDIIIMFKKWRFLDY